LWRPSVLPSVPTTTDKRAGEEETFDVRTAPSREDSIDRSRI
jgi:hypothetical protein